MNNNIESIISKEGFYLFTGNGESMWPLIREGVDVVEIRARTGKEKRGDIILFKEPDRYVLHRIMDVKEGIFITRGDNCIATENVSPEDVAGVMVSLWRGEKKLNLHSPLWLGYSAICLNCPRMFKILKAIIRRI